MSDDESTKITNYDITSPASILNLLPARFRDAIQRIPPELFHHTLEELEQMTPRKKFTSVDARLRVAFWREYERAGSNMTKMQIRNICDGICSETYLSESLMEDKVRIVYLLTKPTSDDIAYEELGFLATAKLREMVELQYIKKDGSIDAKAAGVVVKAIDIALNRSKGAVLQVIHQKNLNMNLNSTDLTGKAIDRLPRDLDELDKELDLLEDKRRNLAHLIPDEVDQDDEP